MIAQWFSSIGDAITAFVSAIGNLFTSIGGLLYTTGENGSLTFLGTLFAIAAAVGIVYWAFRMVRRMLSRAG